MADHVAKWHRDHVNFSRLLDLLETQIDLFHEGQDPDYELMRDVMYYMSNYPDQFHHAKEDVAFRRLMKKERSIGPAVTDLMQQHVVIIESGTRLLRELEAVVAGAMITRESLESPCRAYISSLRNHMKQEDDEVLPLAVKVLDAKDWAAIDAAIEAQEDPLFGAVREQRYEALHTQLAASAETG